MDLYIDNKKADINRTSFAINWKWYCVDDILKRFAVSSTNMTLPFTPVNKEILGYTDMPGSDLTPVWEEKESSIYFNNYLALSGLIKVKKIDSKKKSFETSIRGDNNIINTINANTPRDVMDSSATAKLPAYWDLLQDAVDELFDGSTYGWLLPLMNDGSFEAASGTYHLVNDSKRRHELWISAAEFFTEAFDMISIDLQVFDGGLLRDFSSSDVYSVMETEYMPAYHIGLERTGPIAPRVSWDNDTDRYFGTNNTDVINNADLIILGGKTTWEIVKIISQKFNLGIYIDSELNKIVLFDLNTQPSVSKDFSDKVIDVVKFPVIKGYAQSNYIKFKPTDNLDSDFGKITISNNSDIEYLDTNKTIGTIDVGIPGIYDEYGGTSTIQFANVFSLNYFENKEVYKYPIVLNLANRTTPDIDCIIEDSVGTLTGIEKLYRMSFLDTTSYFGWIENDVLGNNEFYQCKINLSLVDLLELYPWSMITINSIGEKTYINSIRNLNFNKLANVDIVKLV